jgi:glycosyltransferase involved in cell wall biosynthesis
MGTSLRVSVLIPVFSEVDSLRETVNTVQRSASPYLEEILLLLHKNSIPACQETARELARHDPRVRVHLQQKYPGQGHAFREGFDLARGTHVLMMNADLETDPRDVIRLIRAIERDSFDLVVASRWARGARFDLRGYGWPQAFMNYLFQKTFRHFLGTAVTDLTFAYKIGRSDLFKTLPWEGTGHEISLETTVRPILLGYRVGEIPTAWTRRREGSSNHPFRRNLRHLALVLRLARTAGTPKDLK